MNIGHLLRQLPAWWPHSEWPAKALRKYFLMDSDLLAYYFSSDVDPDIDLAEKHDRIDDLVVVTKSFITFYRLSTTGLTRSSDGTNIESQSLDKRLVPISGIASVKVTWGSVGPFSGDAPPEDERSVGVAITFKREVPPFGDVLNVPMREADMERDRELAWHQAETLAESLLLALEEGADPSATLNLSDAEE